MTGKSLLLDEEKRYDWKTIVDLRCTPGAVWSADRFVSIERVFLRENDTLQRKAAFSGCRFLNTLLWIFSAIATAPSDAVSDNQLIDTEGTYKACGLLAGEER